MRTHFRTIILTLAAIVMIAPAVHAQSEALTQGRAAVLLAQRLGFALQTSRTLTEVEAVRLLTENNISPFGGWQIDEALFENDLARMLVQAMGKESEIPEEERDNPQTTAYQDLLIRDYGVEISGTEIPDEALGAELDAQNVVGSAGKRISSDPLISDDFEGDPSQIETTILGANFLPVSLDDFQAALTGIIPSPGGGPAGRPADDVRDTTPSTP